MDDLSDEPFATDEAGFDDRDFYQFNDIGLAARFRSERARADAGRLVPRAVGGCAKAAMRYVAAAPRPA